MIITEEHLRRICIRVQRKHGARRLIVSFKQVQEMTKVKLHDIVSREYCDRGYFQQDDGFSFSYKVCSLDDRGYIVGWSGLSRDRELAARIQRLASGTSWPEYRWVNTTQNTYSNWINSDEA